MLRKSFPVLVLWAIVTTIPFQLKAQNNKTGTWGIVTVVLPGDSTHKWGGYVELQTRTNEFFNQAFYYEIKGGISYDIASNYTALLGTGRYITYDYDDLSGPPTNLETRLWEQLQINQTIDRVKIEHRYRVEQRFFSTGYKNRFRYRLNLAIPLNHRKVIANTWFVGIFNEIFLNNKSPHFERNRFYLGLGYQFTKAISAQLGWMNQYNYTSSSAGAKNNLAINLQYRFNRKSGSPKEMIPGIHD